MASLPLWSRPNTCEEQTFEARFLSFVWVDFHQTKNNLRISDLIYKMSRQHCEHFVFEFKL